MFFGKNSQLPQIPQRLQNLVDFLDAFFATFTKVAGEGGWIGAGFGEEGAQSRDLGGQVLRPRLLCGGRRFET